MASTPVCRDLLQASFGSRRRTARSLTAVLLAWTIHACGVEGGDRTKEENGQEADTAGGGGEPALLLRDATGTRHTFRHPPSRIVSLVPSVSKTLHLLGAGHLLVGRTEYDTASYLTHLPSVGGGLHPSLETLVSLEPDVVIRFAGGSDRTTPERLEDLGIPHFSVRPDGIGDIRGIIRTLGVLTRRTRKADSLLSVLDRGLEEIRDRVRGLPRPRVAYVLGGDPPWVAGPETYIHELIHLAGGDNVFHDLDALYGPVSTEELVVRDMDLLLTPEGGEIGFEPPGVPVREVSPDLEIPGPHVVRAARELARILHPDVFR